MARTRTIDGVREHLFKALEGLSDRTLDLDRAKAISEVAQTIINSAKVEVEFLRATGNDSSKFRIIESVFRFGADVRSGDDPREAQLRLIRDGEAMLLDNATATTEADDSDENDSDAGDIAEEEQA